MNPTHQYTGSGGNTAGFTALSEAHAQGKINRVLLVTEPCADLLPGEAQRIPASSCNRFQFSSRS